jgi:hypothetical protein
MAGSLKWFEYTTDSGDSFGLYMDESNGEAVGNTDFAPLESDDVIYAIPRNVQPRSALYRSIDGKVSRRIAVTDPAATIATLPNAITVAAIDGNPAYQLNLQSFRGEEIKRITGFDSGQDDGDAS